MVDEFLPRPPTISIREGVGYIYDGKGVEHWELKMPVSVLDKLANRARRALDKYALGSEIVVIDD